MTISRWVRQLLQALPSPESALRRAGEPTAKVLTTRSPLLDHFHQVVTYMFETRLSRAAVQCEPREDEVLYRSIALRYLRDGACNAVACGDRSVNCVAFCAGGPPLLAITARVVAAWSEIEPGLPDGLTQDPEGPFQLILSLSRGNRNAESEAVVDRILDEVQLSGEREILERELFGCMVSFIAHHEIAHIVRGHVDLLGQAGLRAAVRESAVDAVAPERHARLRQWVELDADRWAMHFVVGEAIPHDIRASLPEADVITRFRRLVLAVGCLFLILEPRQRSVLEASRSFHPFVPTRVQALLLEASGLIRQICSVSDGLLQQVMAESLHDLSKVFTAAGRDVIGRYKDDLEVVERDAVEIERATRAADLVRAMRKLRLRVSGNTGQ
jgi:hypothetical protein